MLTVLRTSVLALALLLAPPAVAQETVPDPVPASAPAPAPPPAPSAAPAPTPEPAPPAATPATGDQGGDWRAEFEAVCSQTDLAMNLSVEELAQLIARCDSLAGRIGAEPEVVRRLYLKRLKRCRDLLAYVLESRHAAPAGTSSPAP